MPKGNGDDIEDVVWDPGYSLCKPGTVHHRLAQAGVHQTFQPVTHQRGVKPFSGEALLIDGQLFSPLLQELRDLPVPPRGASEEERLAHDAKFNQRARWQLTRHAGPDADGATRWKCPFCSGLLRSQAFPSTMRGSRTAPLVDVDNEHCCDGTLTAMPVELPWRQSITFGTAAWRISCWRRTCLRICRQGSLLIQRQSWMKMFAYARQRSLGDADAIRSATEAGKSPW